MAVSILDAFATDRFDSGNPADYTVSSGSDRVLIVVLSTETNNNTAAKTPTLTYGGQSMTLEQKSEVDVGTSKMNGLYLFTLGESGIAAASNDSFVVGWGGNDPGSATGCIQVSLQDADDSSWREVDEDSSSSAITLDTDLSGINGGMGLVFTNGAYNTGGGGLFTYTGSGWTERVDATFSNHNAGAATRSYYASETSTCTCTTSGSNANMCQIGISIDPVAGGGGGSDNPLNAMAQAFMWG